LLAGGTDLKLFSKSKISSTLNPQQIQDDPRMSQIKKNEKKKLRKSSNGKRWKFKQ